MTDIPDGFEPHFRKSPVTDPWEPLFFRREADGAISLGLRIAAPHCNGRGFLHGGVMAALADNAMGLTYVAASSDNRSGGGSAVTVSLGLDYVAAAQTGAWLTVRPRLIRAGKRMGFVDAILSADDTIIARASATFRAVAG